MSFRASSSVMDQKPSRQVKQKRRSEYGRSNDYDVGDGYQETYKRREKYSNWKHQIVETEEDDE